MAKRPSIYNCILAKDFDEDDDALFDEDTEDEAKPSSSSCHRKRVDSSSDDSLVWDEAVNGAGDEDTRCKASFLDKVSTKGRSSPRDETYPQPRKRIARTRKECYELTRERNASGDHFETIKIDNDSSGSESDSAVIVTNEDGTEQEEYVVEKIVQMRKINGRLEWLVKWKGYPSSDNTWEPESNLRNAKDKLKEYNKRRADRKARGLPEDDPEDIVIDEDEWEDDFDDSIIYYDPGPDLEEIAKDIFQKTIVKELPSKKDMPINTVTLSNREWLSDFFIDDCVFHMLRKFESGKKVVYVPHHHFASVLFAVRHGKEVPKHVIQYLANHRAGLATAVFVCCSTGTMGSDEKSAEHFMLGVICKQRDQTVILDSIKDGSVTPRRDVFRALAAIYVVMYRVEGFRSLPNEYEYIYSKDCRRQTNSYDCGIYVLMNILSILRGRAYKNIPSLLSRKFFYTIMKGVNEGEPPIKREASAVYDVNMAMIESKTFRTDFAPTIDKLLTTKIMLTLLD